MKFPIFLISIIFLISSNFVVFAAVTPGKIPGAGDLGLEETSVKSVPSLLGVLRGIVQVTYTVFFIIAVLFILFAAYKYLTGAGEPEALKTAKKMIIYASIAIAIALLAVGASTIIQNFLVNPSAGGGGTVGGGAVVPREGVDYPSNA